MSKRLTFSRNGEWGIVGVDLSTLPPGAYGALCKLKDIENEAEQLNKAIATERPLFPTYELECLLRLLGVSKYAD